MFAVDTNSNIASHEKQFVKPLIRGFISHIGKNNAISTKEIVLRLAHSKFNKIKWTAQKVFRFARHIQSTGEVVGLCNRNGFWFVAKDQSELSDHIDFLKEKRRLLESEIETLSNQLKDNYS